MLEQNGKTLTPTKAALLLTNKNSVRHKAVVNERQLELAENATDLPSDSQNLLHQKNPNNMNQDSMLVIPLKQSPSLHRKHHWENELKDSEIVKKEEKSLNGAQLAV